MIGAGYTQQHFLVFVQRRINIGGKAIEAVAAAGIADLAAKAVVRFFGNAVDQPAIRNNGAAKQSA